MSYNDQLTTLGKQLDSEITTITQQPSTTHTNEGTAVGTRWDADLASAHPPVVATLYGVSAGDNAVASVNQTHAQRMRTYNQGQLAAGKSAGISEFFHSEKLDMNKLAANDATYRNEVKALFIPVAQGRVAFNHERDNDTPFSLSDTTSANYKDSQLYQRAWLTFINIIADINASRQWAGKLITCPTTTAALYARGNPNWWFVPTADEIGTDLYDPHNFARVMAFARAKGKPWTMPETGYVADPVANPADDLMLSRAKSDNVTYTTNNPPPKSVFWFNNGGNDLTHKPKTAAYWSTLCAKG